MQMGPRATSTCLAPVFRAWPDRSAAMTTSPGLPAMRLALPAADPGLLAEHDETLGHIAAMC